MPAKFEVNQQKYTKMNSPDHLGFPKMYPDWSSIFMVLLFLLLAGLTRAQGDPASQNSIQLEWISRLTGDRPVDKSGFLLSGRSSRLQRKKAAVYLTEIMEQLGLEPKRHRYLMPNVHFFVDLLFAPMTGTNIYAEIPSTTKSQQWIILGAHYDAEPGSPGAVDNAAGLAMILDLAASMAKLEERHRNLMIVLFDQEEDNEVGSRAFTRWLHNQQRRVHSVHITDVIGWDEDGDRGLELQSLPPSLANYYLTAAAERQIPVTITGGASSDNISFMEAGHPTVGIFSDELTPHIHRSTDALSTIDPQHLYSTTELVRTVITQLMTGNAPTPSPSR